MDLRDRINKAKELAGTTKTDKREKKDKPKRSFNPFKYVKESVIELRKVNWPTKQEVINGSIGVILVSALFVVILGGADIIFQEGLNKLIGADSTAAPATQTVPNTEIDPLNLPDGIPPPPGLEGGTTNGQGGVEVNNTETPAAGETPAAPDSAKP